MSDIKRAIRNIPKRQPGEEPVSQRQIGYLRSFGYFSEKLIKNLGVWQASHLIEQAKLIKEEGSANIDASQNKQRKKGGCGKLILFLLVLFVVIGIASKRSGSEDDNPSNESESEVANPKIPVKVDEDKTTKRAKPEGKADPVPEQIPKVVEKSLDLAVIQYPATLVTTERFELLNEVGKETPIPVGTIIKIQSRTDLGTLEMTIGGKLFVGNEIRLKGKIELK